MGTTLSNGGMKTVLTGTETTTIGSTSRQMSLQTSAQVSFADGTTTAAPATARKVMSISGSVTSGTPVDIDLTNLVGAGVDDPLTVANIKGIVIQNLTAAGGGDLLAGDDTGSLSNAVGTHMFATATSQLLIEATGHEGLCKPIKGIVIDSTHKILRLKASTGTVQYQIDALVQ